eukprot:6084646-Amphidinium_carterae.1
MVGFLHDKGYFTCKTFLSTTSLNAMTTMATECDSQRLFKRLPAELEEGYLGRDCAGKTLLLDSQQAMILQSAPMQEAEGALQSIGTFLVPHLEAEFGTGIYTSSDILLSLPFADDSEEDSYPNPELDNLSASDFLNMMWRAGLQVMLNAGPSVGTLRLLPKGEANLEVSLRVTPGSIVAFRPASYRFFYRPGGLTLSLWYLDAPSQYVLSDDVDVSSLKPLLL